MAPESVLIVDDAADEANVLKRVLDADGHAVTVVESVEAARGYLGSNDVRLVLLDLCLPRESGLGLLSNPGLPAHAALPRVIVLTATADRREHHRALELGAADVIRKPAVLPELRAKVRLHLELEQLNRDLQARNAELEQTRAALEQTMALKRQFLALITHDLRSPVTTMKLTAELFHEEVKRAPADVREELAEALQILNRSVLRVETCFGEIIQIGRLDAVGLTLDPVPADIVTLVRDAIQLCTPGDLSGAIALEDSLPEDMIFEVDTQRFGQLVRNLVNTALSRMDLQESGIVRLGLDDRGALRICVEDHGPFLSAAYIREVLDGLQSGVPTPETRVGVYVAHRIAAAHGGRLWLESERGGVTRTCVALPLAKGPAPAARERTAHNPDPGDGAPAGTTRSG